MKSFLLPERWKREAFFIYATTDQSPLLRKILFSIVPLLLGVPTTQQQGTFRKQCLDTGIWFLLARRCMRWKKDDACLSEASCVTFSPPLAFACKLRGTAPKIISARGRRLTGASPKPITYTATAGNFTAIFTTSISSGNFSFKNPSMKSMKICSSP